LADTNYHQLQSLYEKYEADGFRVAAFPCNQFASQEPGTNAEIKASMKAKYGFTFDMFAKIDVNGDNAHPLYKYMKRVQGGWFSNAIKWNYTKFLINRKGVPIYRSSPQTTPFSMEAQIVEELKKSA
jgi:glutathione peroxidase-family protein